MAAKVTFIARHYPPNPNINGESVWDMVKYLYEQYGMESNVICIDRDFEGGGQKRASMGHVTRLKTIYQGNNPVWRFIAFLYDGFILAKAALKYRDTLIVCTTSPPMLPFWASMLFGKKVKWGLWVFDLFPEGFQVTNLIGSNNLFYRYVIKKTYRNAPSFIIALGPKQAEYVAHAYRKEIPVLLLPCGVFFYQEKAEAPPDWWEADKIILGYCGNVSDPHNPDFIKAVIDRLDADRQLLVLALYGKHAAALKAYAQGKPGIRIVDNVPRSQLRFIDIHLVSLRYEWTHIAVPSKAVSAVSLGSTILFCGSRESDNWYLLQQAGWLIDEWQDIGLQVGQFVAAVTRAEIEQKKAATAGIYEDLKENIRHTYQSVRDRAL